VEPSFFLSRASSHAKAALDADLDATTRTFSGTAEDRRV
jgi:hypothetical protein